MKQLLPFKTVALSGTALLMGMTSSAFAGEPIAAPLPCVAADCGTAGWTFNAAVLAMQPHQSEGYFHDADTDAGYRFGLAYERPDGLRFSASVFGFDGNAEYDGDPVDVDYFTFDLMVGDTFCPTDDLSIALDAGLRYGTYEENWDGWTGADFEGIGPVVSIDVVRQLGGAWALYATATTSILFGDNDLADGDSSNPNAGDNSTVFIAELGAGVQYSFGSGYARLGGEAQFWEGLSDYDSENTSLAGLILELGWNF